MPRTTRRFRWCRWSRSVAAGRDRRGGRRWLLRDAAAPLAGVDLSVRDLELSSVELAPGVAKVTVESGRVEAEVTGDGLSTIVGNELAATGSIGRRFGVNASEVAAKAGLDAQPFVIAVRDGGSWYVSPAYTTLEWVREVKGLPPADFGSGREVRGGADTPDAAVRGAVEAMAARDWDRLWTYVPAEELPLYDYREALRAQLADAGPALTIEELTTRSEIDGDTAVVTVTASGRDADNKVTWRLNDDCRGVSDATCGSDDLGLSLGQVWTVQGLLSADLETVTQVPALRVVAVERDGRWYVSPASTVFGGLVETVRALERDELYFWFDLEEWLPADGELALGQEVVVPADREVVVYEFDGRAGQQVVARTVAGDGEELPLSVSLFIEVFGPDGEDVGFLDDWTYDTTGSRWEAVPVELPADGRYRVMIHSAGEAARVTLYDAESAPEEVLYQSGSECSPTTPVSDCYQSWPDGWSELPDA